MAKPTPKRQFVYFIKPAREDFLPDNATDFEKSQIAAHWDYIQTHHDAGTVIMVGRTTEPPFMAMAVFEAEDEECARAFMERDSAIASGVCVGEIRPFQTFLLAKD